MKPIVTAKEKCRKCYSCVRSCPVKAIRVEKEHSEIIHERCIGCGNCVLECPQKAKIITPKAPDLERLLAAGEPVAAVLGCAYPAYFHGIRPGQLVAALLRLGFREVHEGTFGAEMIAGSYARAIEESTEPLISSHCPAIVDLIERHYPKLIPNLVPYVSPMIAMGRFIKGEEGGARVVYISSCIASKFDVDSGETNGAVDMVIMYRELEEMFRSRGINPDELDDEPFAGVQPHLGRLFPISEGSFKAFSIATHPLDTEIITAEGEVNVMGIIRDLAARRIRPRIADLRFCYGGCIGGPGTKVGLTEFYKRNLVISHFKRDLPYATDNRYLNRELPPLERTFSDAHAHLETPRGSDVQRILNLTNKFSRKDELNCRACGYRTCREYAVAVFQGLADLEMCLPFNLHQLEEDRGRLLTKYELARRELDREYGDEFIVGNDRKTLEVLDLIKQVGPTPTTVLIRGESGTGKELTARAIHRYSKRNDKPLVTVNCTTITESLLESELFGHRKGSFTGAVADKKGLFEAADGGTIFLDEIGDISPKLQAELLRVLDQGEVRPVGGTASKKVDIRLIAATNRNLEEGVRDGWFREDLYYRLNVFSITMPPLRSRVESIPILAHHFLENARRKLNKNVIGIEDRAITAMIGYPWPGNIREMQNVIERGAVLTHDSLIRLDNLPSIFREQRGAEGADNGEGAGLRDEVRRHSGGIEKKLILQFLAESGGNVLKAAALAGIPRRTFYRIMTRHGISGKELKSSLKPNL